MLTCKPKKMLSLHIHSNYSLLQSSLAIDSIVGFAKQCGNSYAALTDTNSMAGLIKFAKTAEAVGIKPILGAYIDSPSNKKKYAVFLAKNNSGYFELCRLITARNLDEKFSIILTIQNTSDNLFILTSNLDILKNISFTKRLKKNLFAELIVTEKQKKNTRLLFSFAKENKIKIIASHPAYFTDKSDYKFHRVVSAIGQNTTVENLAPDELTDSELYLKTPKEFSANWKALPEAIKNTDFIAENCNVNMEFGKYKFPTYPVHKGETAFTFLWEIAFEGLAKHYNPVPEKAVKRLEYELKVIDELGFSDYFLIVWDIVKEANKRNMVTVGRGSAADSLAAYCLNLTQVDPVKHNLYFERFLNKGRSSPPDVDIDFSWKERDQIVQYIFDKYGYNHVAMISTTVTFRARSAFRETAKAFGIGDSEISKFSKHIPWTSAKNLANISKLSPESKSLDFRNEPWKTIINYASKLDGFPRYRSIHPSGILITEKPINNYTALEYAKNKGLGLIITQLDMYSIEDLGLVKIDLLSQRALGVLRDTLEKIK